MVKARINAKMFGFLNLAAVALKIVPHTCRKEKKATEVVMC